MQSNMPNMSTRMFGAFLLAIVTSVVARHFAFTAHEIIIVFLGVFSGVTCLTITV